MKQIISITLILLAIFTITAQVSASSNIHKTVDNKGRVTYANAQGKITQKQRMRPYQVVGFILR